jgi:hypothetical protein
MRFEPMAPVKRRHAVAMRLPFASPQMKPIFAEREKTACGIL